MKPARERMGRLTRQLLGPLSAWVRRMFYTPVFAKYDVAPGQEAPAVERRILRKLNAAEEPVCPPLVEQKEPWHV